MKLTIDWTEDDISPGLIVTKLFDPKESQDSPGRLLKWTYLLSWLGGRWGCQVYSNMLGGWNDSIPTIIKG